MKAERGEEASCRSLKLMDVSSWRLRKKALHHIKVQGEITSADTEAATRYPEGLAEIITEGDFTK